MPLDINPSQFELLAHDFISLSQDTRYIHLFEVHVGFPAEFPHVVNNLRSAIHVVHNLVGEPQECFMLDVLFFVYLSHKEVAGGIDDRKGLVEFMGHAGGHFPEGGHLAGLY